MVKKKCKILDNAYIWEGVWPENAPKKRGPNTTFSQKKKEWCGNKKKKKGRGMNIGKVKGKAGQGRFPTIGERYHGEPNKEPKNTKRTLKTLKMGGKKKSPVEWKNKKMETWGGVTGGGGEKAEKGRAKCRENLDRG